MPVSYTHLLLTETWMIDAGRYTKYAGAECLHPIFYNMTKEVVAEVKSQGIKINTWTVNEEEDIRTMIARGVDSIICLLYTSRCV